VEELTQHARLTQYFKPVEVHCSMSNSDYEYFRSLLPEIDLIEDTKLRDQVVQVFLRSWHDSKWKKIEDQPFPGVSKLTQIEHLHAVIRISIEIARTLQEIHHIKINNDYLLASVILHDVSDMVEFDPPGGEENRSELGRAVIHPLYGVKLTLDEKIPLPIISAIVSHTHKSLAVPSSIEALILFYADTLDCDLLKKANGVKTNAEKSRESRTVLGQ
jgi:hypothetical protein